MTTDEQLCVRVHAPARLHLGFLDLNGSLGRRFGSVGLALEEVAVVLSARPAPALRVVGAQAERAQRYAETFLRALQISGGAQIDIQQAIPEHVGLGSGTQLALAVGAALKALYARSHSVRELALLHARGQRSGIGVGAFEQGGFVVDGGRGDNDAVPPVIMRLEFPAPWRVILIQDACVQGLHGEHEVRAFAALPPLPETVCGQLCRLVLMQVAPALAEHDLTRFGQGIAQLQRLIGDYFAPAQGGRFSSPRVARALAWFEQQGVHGVGQSSWGPTGFAFVPDEITGHRLLRAAPAEGLSMCLLQARNRGAHLSVPQLAGTAQVLDRAMRR